MRGIVTRMLSSEIVPRLDKFATVAVTGAAVGRGGSRGGRDLRRCCGVSSNLRSVKSKNKKKSLKF